ncbi:DUF2905 domain-containing protein [Halomonas maura]|uniref:DUF2905 domain-containing protein n=1 Tax=Halomonas maura TaxID=117606 RepID=UPI0025B594BA|nr:DUF2905 domain-containing protein [Halomonas maura]MDN3557984.1 DUF2905 domain-containing protein [Halomonas maura]
MSKTLILTGLLLVAAGVLWPWLGKLPLGHLPGDLLIRRGNTTVYVPLTTMLLISVVLTLLLWLFRR